MPINHQRPELILRDNLRKFQEHLNNQPLPDYYPIISYEDPYPKIHKVIKIIGKYYDSYLKWFDFIEKDVANLKTTKSDELIGIRNDFYTQMKNEFRIMIFYAAMEMKEKGFVSKPQENFLKLFLKSIKDLDEAVTAFKEELENAAMEGF